MEKIKSELAALLKKFNGIPDDMKLKITVFIFLSLWLVTCMAVAGQTIIYPDGTQYTVKEGENIFVTRANKVYVLSEIQKLNPVATPEPPPVVIDPRFSEPVGSEAWCAATFENLTEGYGFDDVYYQVNCGSIDVQ